MGRSMAKGKAPEAKRRTLFTGADARIRITRCPPQTEAALFISGTPVQHVREEEGVCTLDPLTFGGRRAKPVQKIPKSFYEVQVLTSFGGYHMTAEGVPPGHTIKLPVSVWLRYWWRRYVLRVKPLPEVA